MPGNLNRQPDASAGIDFDIGREIDLDRRCFGFRCGIRLGVICRRFGFLARHFRLVSRRISSIGHWYVGRRFGVVCRRVKRWVGGFVVWWCRRDLARWSIV